VSTLRAHRLDVGLVVLAVVVLVTSLGESIEHVRYGSAVVATALLVLLGRSWRPPAASLLVFALLAAGGHVTPQITGPMFVAILACFGVAGTLPRRSALIAWGAGCLAMIASMAGNPYVQGAGDVALTLTFCTIIWAAGLFAADRARQAGEAAARADEVAAGRDLDVASATAHERARIAGELHDIVSHGLSIVILQTVAARMALQDGPGPVSAVDRRLDAVESTARAALDDMRRLLDLLRPVDGDTVTDDILPSVGLEQVPALVAQAEQAGVPVETSYDVTGPEVSPGLDAAAYRIVQEAITNILKHAPGASARVCIRRTESLLVVSVADRGGARSVQRPHGAGYGLIGMRQRAELYGGHLTAAPYDDGFQVTASFPVSGPT
jgi:signal transduction histidine kinase